ncbi:MAG: UDP-N-acetylglucosamine--N-acetylmuramyl-(pentapeptide) pyrophosphoryl-undecaprenol N-acetylglucosamine transferase [Candidatus Delongbacteria bacterium]|jgi:UDP-N-acetylglucosamine--N-acetylmuramyl-(pentapeptide) pyrophosphoryl-undecaprenol N-acetylglucosamine transferase|nr:UDP-N-acetylglucosamine--N-acetylmuramyl-(pentapeptide) pyrophosphoryl-undecaprenol N-acetylglucosamine transferase [Candidatus Delongbacteria bacterium]
MKYILTGGGTGGHVYPALAIANYIKTKDKDAKFLYIGTHGRIEAKIVPAKGYKIKFIPATGLPGSKFSLKFLLFVISLFFGIFKSCIHIVLFRPNIIIGTGGFVSASPIFAGRLLRKLKLSKAKLFLHEANAEPGKMIRKAGPMCDGVGLSYKSCLEYFKNNGKYVGYPVRDEFKHGTREESRKNLGIDKDLFVVFVVGGSQGARTINRSIVDSLRYLKDLSKLKIIHVTGKGTVAYNGVLDTIRRFGYNSIDQEDFKFYSRMDYAENIKDYYLASDLIITRGGGTINEIAVCGRVSLIIPKANLSGDHQVINAEDIKDAGAAEVIYEDIIIDNEEFAVMVSGKKLSEKIIELYNDKDRIAELEKNAKNYIKDSGTEKIYQFIEEILNNTNKKEYVAEEIIEKNPYANFRAPQLINILSKMSKEEVISNKYLDYLRYRTSHYFNYDAWQVRNYAVKLSGLTYAEEKIPFLSKLFNDTRKVSFLQRFFGGEYQQVNFIRRNIMTAYRKIGRFSETVEKDILSSLNDKYFETVSEGLLNVIYFSKELRSNEKVVAEVKMLLKHKNFLIVINAVAAYTKFINDIDKFEDFSDLFFNTNNKVRQAVIESLLILNQKGIVEDKKIIDGFLGRILQTTTEFSPVFKFKKLIKQFEV